MKSPDPSWRPDLCQGPCMDWCCDDLKRMLAFLVTVLIALLAYIVYLNSRSRRHREDKKS